MLNAFKVLTVPYSSITINRYLIKDIAFISQQQDAMKNKQSESNTELLEIKDRGCQVKYSEES